MMTSGNFEARLMWRLLFCEADGMLCEPSVDYGGLLEGMEAAQLMALMVKVQERLEYLGVGVERLAEPIELYIDKKYNIRMGVADGQILQLRPLVKTLFILFLRHPEGILLKHRDDYRTELEEIYSTINPNTFREDVKARVSRLVDLEDNSFSEKASVLNARLEALLPNGIAGDYQIRGHNGCPRKIRLNPLLVHWE
jgi:hypothetical protein